MKKQYPLILISLLLSLFIYVFYRTEKTVINEVILAFVPRGSFFEARKAITYRLPLNEPVIYSLPEGLWVFCITLTSELLFLKIGRRKYPLLFVPPLFSIGLELFQLLQLTNGRFDLWDIAASILFWAIAHYLIKTDNPKQDILKPFNTRSLVCLSSYLIVYLAHVWNE